MFLESYELLNGILQVDTYLIGEIKSPFELETFEDWTLDDVFLHIVFGILLSLIYAFLDVLFNESLYVCWVLETYLSNTMYAC
jgi:hypothetical protein